MTSNDNEGRLTSLPGELRLLLREIESEKVPERLLELATELQRALARQRRGNPGPADDTSSNMPR